MRHRSSAPMVSKWSILRWGRRCGRRTDTSPSSSCRYKNDREISAMTALVDAYQRRSVHEAEKILRSASSRRSRPVAPADRTSR